MSKRKHTICIIAHKDVCQINNLIILLDHPRIDIFLHIDKKSSIVPSKEVVTPKHSKLYFVKRHDVRWGDVSQIETEIELYRTVLESGTDYALVHLISAQDMPMKSVSYILRYFDSSENKGKEFINFGNNPSAHMRLKYYWFCTRHMRKGYIFKIIRHTLIVLQKIAHINRLKGLPFRTIKYGSEWVSLTLAAMKYIISEYPKHKRVFQHSVCADELYKQTLLWGNFQFSKKAIFDMQNLMGLRQNWCL